MQRGWPERDLDAANGLRLRDAAGQRHLELPRGVEEEQVPVLAAHHQAVVRKPGLQATQAKKAADSVGPSEPPSYSLKVPKHHNPGCTAPGAKRILPPGRTVPFERPLSPSRGVHHLPVQATSQKVCVNPSRSRRSPRHVAEVVLRLPADVPQLVLRRLEAALLQAQEPRTRRKIGHAIQCTLRREVTRPTTKTKKGAGSSVSTL